ncbi:flagellin [Glaciecola sp.]|jgi:flagellin|uniref:flagellin n=1 Tax=Glaciecola sp. MF2-115 TaxID=3384827 RepID=UPI00398A0BBC|mmetsp:Transcript_56105/g.177777  ORF Transcript_56105/g.177777 Transcript_56105/m.177777 type:complete len:267 (-) Transcript_56105:1507-2307(-)|eukprot:CAMPEP_0182890176 /NCGR_PEP_ID=MMETSP0034_2-20130328/22496_1 /TAXON_ID=156128 /ORGANISM="Nephroselmis pyriformis, Strain CCMP717" /LENGTH=266 /DNA_ID=CAMNT_0025023709 /DNA_START=75 /DNA_END=875 /DNA_ORIENTATION=+
MIKFESGNTGNLLQQIQQKQSSLLEKLASGKEVNSAADGPAAQLIIDRLTSQTEGSRQAISNAYDGISLAQVAESGLANITDDANRIRELTVQAGNGSLNDADRQALQSEISALQENISLTVEQTNFAGKPLLSGGQDISFLVGSSSGSNIDVENNNVTDSISDLLSIDITNEESREAALEIADTSLETIGGYRGDLGAVQNQFASAARVLSESDINTQSARSRIQDLDFAQATSELAASQVQGQASLTLQAQANQQQGQVLALLG